ncbi:MAG: hypothetical protein AMXMBFR13_30590 [Phycisphaerae bacterium]
MLSVTVHEAGSDAPIPCRAWVQAGDQRLFEPQGDECTPYKKDRSFACEGNFTMEVPAGRIMVHVERGTEYVPHEAHINITAGATIRLRIPLERWINMREEGWYSADLHVHFGHDNPVILQQLARADDVNLVPAFTYWNEFREQWPIWPEGANLGSSPSHLVTRRNIEIERIGGDPYHSVGALLIFGLTQPIHVERHDHTWPPDAVLARMAKQSSPDCVIDTDKPQWGENVVGVALGLFDSAQLCHNHFHRESSMRMCCGMALAEVKDGKLWPDANELLARTNETYYRWLNCGFRLAATGGSAMGVMPVPLGYSRTYAKLDGPLTEKNYLKAVRAGRTFATSGPMVLFTVNGSSVGSLIECSSSQPEKLTARIEVRGFRTVHLSEPDANEDADASIKLTVRQLPKGTIELLANGQVIAQKELGTSMASGGSVQPHVLEATVEPKRSGWLAARVMYEDPPGHRRQAHTSPVYLAVDGKPTASKTDAEYMMRWIDRLLEISEKPERYSQNDDRVEAQKLYREARAVYEGIARRAVDVWGEK